LESKGFDSPAACQNYEVICLGDRVSIQFINKKDAFEPKSVVLFSHGGGMDFVKQAKAYAKRLKEFTGTRTVTPLERHEPNTVMVDFIREITKGMDKVDSGLYLAVDEYHGDNSDNGHHKINITK